jgi:hypothetical protein
LLACPSEVAPTRDIRTNQTDVACDICGRTLLRGEHAEPFLAGGARKQVCELCIARAQHEGWIPEAGADEYTLHRSRGEGRGRSWLERVRARRERARELSAELEAAAATDAAPAWVDDEAEYEPEAVEAAPEPIARPPRAPRHVRAVPTNADLKMQRALDVFNTSEHVRTVGGVARSLGAPEVCVRPLDERPSVVAITVMWELSWYRYEIDLSDEAGGVRRDAQGDELTELAEHERTGNAEADERGLLHLTAAATG